MVPIGVVSALPAPAATVSPTAKRRLEFLDALRGLAAIYVVFFHVVHMPQPNLAVAPWLAPWIAGGGSGVALFFVISAFSLFYTMPKHQARPLPRTSFYLHRLFRIAPLFLCWLAFSVWRDGRGAHVGPGIGEIAANASFVFNLNLPWQPGIVWAGWTIGVEMLFYAIFPLFFWLVRGPVSAVAAIGFALLASWAAHIWLDPSTAALVAGPYGFLRHLPVFALGGLAFFLWRRVPEAGGRLSRVLGVALIAAAIAGFLALAYGWISATPLGGSWFAMGCTYVMLLLGLALAPWRALVNPLTSALGTVSYSLYLAHPQIVALLTPAYRRIESAFGAAYPTLTLLGCVGMTLALLLPVSWISYRLIERPGIRAGRWLIDRISPRRRIIESRDELASATAARPTSSPARPC